MVTGRLTKRTAAGGLQGLIRRLNDMKGRTIYVGIPQERSSREGGAEGINNAELLYIHTNGIRRQSMRREMDANMAGGMKYSAAYSLYIQSHGSPLWQSPPRPVLEPAIKANKNGIMREFRGIGKAASRGDEDAMERAIIRTGLAAQNACRSWFTDPRNGWPPNAPETIQRKGSDNPLIDTGTLRKSIIYVVRPR